MHVYCVQCQPQRNNVQYHTAKQRLIDSLQHTQTNTHAQLKATQTGINNQPPYVLHREVFQVAAQYSFSHISPTDSEIFCMKHLIFVVGISSIAVGIFGHVTPPLRTPQAHPWARMIARQCITVSGVKTELLLSVNIVVNEEEGGVGTTGI